MYISNIFNLTSISRNCELKKHKTLLFNNGVIKALTPDEIDDIVRTIKIESEKTIKELNKIKKERLKIS